MNDDNWLNQLQQLREQNQAEREIKLDLSVLNCRTQARDVLSKCKAHKILRQAQKALLGGLGAIDIFDRTKQYDRTITLVWQGPISKARIPKVDDPTDYYYILAGVRGGRLYVNGKLTEATPEALKQAIVAISKKPGRWPNGDK